MKMRTFKLNKLVRDGIVADHEKEGGSCVVRKLSDEELVKLAEAKVREEVAELFDEPVVKEFGDVLEAVQLLAEVYGFSETEIEQARKNRSDEMGDFSNRIYIENVTVPENSWLAKYYGSKPERFPEI